MKEWAKQGGTARRITVVVVGIYKRAREPQESRRVGRKSTTVGAITSNTGKRHGQAKWGYGPVAFVIPFVSDFDFYSKLDENMFDARDGGGLG